MTELTRFSIAIDGSLFRRFEAARKKAGYRNRSEYLRDIIRDRLVRDDWEENREAVGTITLVYDHHQRELSRKLTAVQHDHPAHVLAATHVHLDHDHCVEAILVRGRARQIRDLADSLGQQRGVLHSSLSLGTVGADLT